MSCEEQHLDHDLVISKVDSRHLLTYTVLFLIENGLRELIIEELQSVSGSRWYRQRLSRDLLAKYEEGAAYDRSTRWIEMVPHHPLYYLDFPDLKKILLRNDNWNDAFRRIFKSQEMLTGTLSELEPIRNKIAHHRLISDQDRSISLSGYFKIVEAIGQDRWNILINQQTYIRDIKYRLNDLKKQLLDAYRECALARPLKGAAPWRATIDAWWFDSVYLGSSVVEISQFFGVAEEYMLLKRSRGDGYKIERWLADRKFQQLYELASTEIDSLLE